MGFRQLRVDSEVFEIHFEIEMDYFEKEEEYVRICLKRDLLQQNLLTLDVLQFSL